MPHAPKHSSNSKRTLTVLLVLVTSLGLHQLGCVAGWSLLGAAPSMVQGKVIAPSTVGDADPVVVYLESLERRQAHAHAKARSPAVIRVRDGAFSPRVIAVAPAQPLAFAIEGNVLHQLFSYNEHNAFNLGTSDGGGTVSVTLERPGVVRVYCSLHPSESGIAFVLPSQYFAVADPRGRWKITGVAPGRYQLKTWSAATQPTERTITVPTASTIEAPDVLLSDVARATQ